jgi:putative adhesin/cell wall-active antibiotic response 4TMS protein YvqF
VSNGGQRRGSIFAGLLLIVLGAILFVNRLNPEIGLGHLIRVYWPLLIILWGLAKLVDYWMARRTGQAHPSMLSGGELALMILLAFVLTGFVFRDWIHSHHPGWDVDEPIFAHSYKQDRVLPVQTIPAGAHVTIGTWRGAISVHTNAANELRVGAHYSAGAESQSEADAKLKGVDVAIEQAGGGYSIHPVHQEDFGGTVSVDLDVNVPKTASVTVHTGYGDVSVAGVGGNVEARSERGDIEVQDAGADVTTESQKGDVQVAKAAGNVTVVGRGSDVEISDVGGNATIKALFVGEIEVSNVAKTVECESPWAEATLTHLTGKLTGDPRNIEVSGVSGGMKLVTHNKDLDVEGVSGRVEIFNTHGDVKVSYSGRLQDDLSIANDSGEVELTLPANAGFQISALSRSGEVKSEFGDASLSVTNADSYGKIEGKVGAGGPKIMIVTSYGTIHLNKGE